MDPIEPEPPPIQHRTTPPPIPQQVPPPFVPHPRQQPSNLDLSSTDGRTVVSLACAALGMASCMVCTFAGPLAPAVGIVLAIFAKPSYLRTTAIIANSAVMLLSFLWIVLVFADAVQQIR